MRFVAKIICIPSMILLLSLFSCSSGEKKRTSVSQTYRSGEAVLTASVSDREITTAGKITFTLALSAPWEAEALWPSFGDKLGEFTLTSVSRPKQKGGKEERTESRVLTLEPFLSGTYYIPAVEIRLRRRDSLEYNTIATKPIRIEVTSLLEGEKQKIELKDITGPMKVPLPAWTIVLIAGGTLGVAGAAFFLLRMLKKRKEDLRKGHPADPYELASGELARLRGSDLLKKGKKREYYFTLSAILRRFLEGRFSLKAPERTTEEFLRELKGSSLFREEAKKRLGGFLLRCDRVKFARYVPDEGEIERDFSFCESFIREIRVEEGEEEK